jgi:hypothetical protein
MLTAAVRDLHLCHPGEFQTDVRTTCPDLWINNPYITEISDGTVGVEVVDCHYPLIHMSNTLPYHFIHGFMQFLNDRLGTAIQPSAFHGDIHLADNERKVPGLFRTIETVSYWLIVSGGKFDYTIKWWDASRYQEVVDYFLGEIVFVQVGAIEHYHPPLKNVVDLRGKTTLRDLIRLVYFADGCVTPVSLLMHLAPAIEKPEGRGSRRPCVVVAGGREPPHWETYPTHAFLHTVGRLPCCASGGCWRSRTKALGDNTDLDRQDKLCVDVVGELPRCMDMIAANDVIKEVRRYSGVTRSNRRRNTEVHGWSTNVETSQGSLFVTVSDSRFFIGTVATCRAIRLFHPDARIVVVNSNVVSGGLDVRQKEMLEAENNDVVDGAVFDKAGRKLGPWELKAYAASDLSKAFRERVIIGIDSDCILCGGVHDVIERCMSSGCFAGGRDRAQKYDERFKAYGLRVPMVNRQYMSTALYFCHTNDVNGNILTEWAECCSQAVFNGTGKHPGHGDQGILNAILMKHGHRILLLDNRLWSQHWTYWNTDVIYDEEARSFINMSASGKRQRAFHCGGTHKFWSKEHSVKVSLDKGQLLGYCWFLWLILGVKAEEVTREIVKGEYNHMIDDYRRYRRVIEPLEGLG